MQLDHSFVNTDLFKPAAKAFEKDGMYTTAREGTQPWIDYWIEQKRRCLEGYSAGGVSITGTHYFYLNFCVISIINSESAKGASADKVTTFPRFYDGDYNFFWAKKIAKEGISDENLKKLNLAFTPLHTSGGKHLVVLKARRKGYSYKAAGILVRNFVLKRNTNGYCYAHLKEFLTGDGLLSKCWDMTDFISKHTPFGQPLLIDKVLHKRTGYKQKIKGSYVEMGTKNDIIGVSTNGDPGKVRGKAGENIFFEEAGKYPELIDAWEIAKPSVTQGKYTVGTMVAYGTGGTEDADYESLEELFYSPDSYDALPLMNIWDEGMESDNCGFFVPAYINLDGFMDKDGNSQIEKAKKHVLERRETKKEENSSPKAIRQEISQHPMNPKEAVLRISSNVFPVELIQEQLQSVIAEGRQHAYTPGILYRTSEGKVKFKTKPNTNAIFRFPLPSGSDRNGAIAIKEAPYTNADGKTPANMYLLGHDPYAHDGSPEGGSLGSTYVFKRTNNISRSLNECIVASYVGRPALQDDYNNNMFMLAEYYNAKIAFENNVGDVVSYAKRFKLLQYLEETFDVLDIKDRRTSRRTTRSYGIHMNQQRKRQGELYIRDWLMTPLDRREDGSTKLVLHTILDPALLNELLRYNEDGNFDRVMSIMIAMYYLTELQYRDREVKEDTMGKDRREFFKGAFFN